MICQTVRYTHTDLIRHVRCSVRYGRNSNSKEPSAGSPHYFTGSLCGSLSVRVHLPCASKQGTHHTWYVLGRDSKQYPYSSVTAVVLCSCVLPVMPGGKEATSSFLIKSRESFPPIKSNKSNLVQNNTRYVTPCQVAQPTGPHGQPQQHSSIHEPPTTKHPSTRAD